MIVRFGWKNLLHDPVRAGTAVAGVLVAVLLLVLQIGLLDGSSRTASGIIDHADADLWVTAPNTCTFDFGDTVLERRFTQVLCTPGVARAERMVLAFGKWKSADGRQQNVLLIGLEPDAHLAGPWELAAGARAAWRLDEGVVIDEQERHRFGVSGRPLALGDRTEINGRRAEVVGFSRGVGSFTTVPFVFTSLRTAWAISDFGENYVTYVLVRAARGVDPAALARRLRALPGVDVLTRETFTARTRDYWIFGTGLGLGLVLTAVLALVVGGVIVGQTIYTMTEEKRREYGTLKALGYGAADLMGAVLVQAGALGAAGYVLGLAISATFVRCVPLRGVAIRFSPELALGVLALTGLLTLIASISSIARLARMEPAAVFRQ